MKDWAGSQTGGVKLLITFKEKVFTRQGLDDIAMRTLTPLYFRRGEEDRPFFDPQNLTENRAGKKVIAYTFTFPDSLQAQDRNEKLFQVEVDLTKNRILFQRQFFYGPTDRDEVTSSDAAFLSELLKSKKDLIDRWCVFDVAPNSGFDTEADEVLTIYHQGHDSKSLKDYLHLFE